MRNHLQESMVPVSMTTGPLTTDDGMNLLEPGDTPHENIQFLTCTCLYFESS